jgi:hypothetical protein
MARTARLDMVMRIARMALMARMIRTVRKTKIVKMVKMTKKRWPGWPGQSGWPGETRWSYLSSVASSSSSPGDRAKSLRTMVLGCRPGFVGANWIFLHICKVCPAPS